MPAAERVRRADAAHILVVDIIRAARRALLTERDAIPRHIRATNMPSAFSDPTVSAVLDRLFADAEVTNAPLRAIEEAGSERDAPAT